MATNPAALIATNPARCTKSCDIQLHQTMQSTTSPAIQNGKKSRSINCNKPYKMHQMLQYSTATSPVKCNCNKTLQDSVAANPRSSLGWFFGTGQALTGRIPFGEKQSCSGRAGCSSQRSAPAQHAVGDGPRSTNPDLPGGKHGSVPRVEGKIPPQGQRER